MAAWYRSWRRCASTGKVLVISTHAGFLHTNARLRTLLDDAALP
jgi:hypothetical protein